MLTVQLKVKKLIKNSSSSLITRIRKTKALKVLSAWNLYATEKKKAKTLLIRRLEYFNYTVQKQSLEIWRSHTKAVHLALLQMDYTIQETLIAEISSIEEELEKSLTVYSPIRKLTPRHESERKPRVRFSETVRSANPLTARKQRLGEIEQRLDYLMTGRGVDLDRRVRAKPNDFEARSPTIDYITGDPMEKQSNSYFDDSQRAVELKRYIDGLADELEAKKRKLYDLQLDIAKTSKVCRELGFRREAQEEASYLIVQVYQREIEKLTRDHLAASQEYSDLYSNPQPRSEMYWSPRTSPSREALKAEIDTRIKRMESRVTELQKNV